MYIFTNFYKQGFIICGYGKKKVMSFHLYKIITINFVSIVNCITLYHLFNDMLVKKQRINKVSLIIHEHSLTINVEIISNKTKH